MHHRPRTNKARLNTLATLSLAILIGVSIPVLANPSPPDTPAGHTLQAFLDAFNTGDHDRIASYVQQYDPQSSVDRWVSFAAQTGGFSLTSIVISAPDRVSFLTHGRTDNLDAYGVLQLASSSPPHGKRLSIRAIPPRETIDDIPLDAAQRQKTISAISEQLTTFYVYPEVAAKMVKALHDHQTHGDYNPIVEGNDFADVLERDLRAVSNDRHLFVIYDPFTSRQQADRSAERQPGPAEEAYLRSSLEHQNCTFSKLEILSHNIGYMKFDAFLSPEICGPTVVAAMSFLAHTDALIFDLRQNHGGDPAMVDFIVSYLFRQPTHINDLANRHDSETHQFWTLPWVPGPRFVDQPVYILTSHETLSGGEEFTFDLKTQKRATIVGETTGGGAHPVRPLPAGAHFTIGVPYARPINPVTKGDWERRGVEPDVQTSAADALMAAEKLAIERVSKKDTDR